MDNTHYNSGNRTQRNNMFSEYNNVMRLYQENMRLYQENFRIFLESPNTSEQRGVPRSARRRHQTQNLFLPSEYPDRNSIYTNIIDEAINSVFPNTTPFSDVVVHPTEEQINRATTLFLYNSNHLYLLHLE
jgi:hypothetical protein